MDGEWMSWNTGNKHIRDIDNMWNEKQVARLQELRVIGSQLWTEFTGAKGGSTEEIHVPSLYIFKGYR